MAEAGFERQLERLFAEAPEFPDAGAFAERVEKPADLPGALQRARDAVVNEKRQALLNVITPY